MKKISGNIIILHMCTINDNHYDVWFVRYGVLHTEFFVILDHFLPFYPSNNLKNQNFEKLKKKQKQKQKQKNPGDIIILHTHVPKIMIIYYAVPEIQHAMDVIFIFIVGYFLPFYSPNTPKNQN